MDTPKFDLIICASGLEQDRQLEIRDAFSPFAAKVSEWASKVALVGDSKIARETRWAMRRERIELDKKHADFKSRTLAWTRAVDGSKKCISDAYEEMETQMEEVEKAEANRIAVEKAAKKGERDAAFRQYGMDVTWIQTGEMTDAQFLDMLAKAKAAKEAADAAAKRAEEERIAKDKADAEAKAERARIDAEAREVQRIENERLKREAVERENVATIERVRVAAEQAEAARILAEVKVAAEVKAKAERDAAASTLKAEQENARKQREKLEAEAKKLRNDRARAQAEVQAKVDAEAKKAKDEADAKALAEAAPDAEKLRGIADKLTNLLADLPELQSFAGREFLSRAEIKLKTLIENIRADADKMEGK